MTKVQKLFRNIKKLTSQERNQNVTRKYMVLLITFSSLLILSISSIVYVAASVRRNSKVTVRTVSRELSQELVHFDNQVFAKESEISVKLEQLPSASPAIPLQASQSVNIPENTKLPEIPAAKSPTDDAQVLNYTDYTDPPEDDLDNYFGALNGSSSKRTRTRDDACYRYNAGKCHLSPCPGKKSASSSFSGFVRELDASKSPKNRTRGACHMCTVHPKQCLVSRAHRCESCLMLCIVADFSPAALRLHPADRMPAALRPSIASRSHCPC